MNARLWPSFDTDLFSCKCQLVSIKTLANEDTLLQTHCCRHKCFPVCPRAQHLLQTQILRPGHKICFWFCSELFCVRNKCFPVCADQETSWATMCPQQCVLVYQGRKDNLICTIKVVRSVSKQGQLQPRWRIRIQNGLGSSCNLINVIEQILKFATTGQ